MRGTASAAAGTAACINIVYRARLRSSQRRTQDAEPCLGL